MGTWGFYLGLCARRGRLAKGFCPRSWGGAGIWMCAGRGHSLPFSDVEGTAGLGLPDAPATLQSVCRSAGWRLDSLARSGPVDSNTQSIGSLLLLGAVWKLQEGSLQKTELPLKSRSQMK